MVPWRIKFPANEILTIIIIAILVLMYLQHLELVLTYFIIN